MAKLLPVVITLLLLGIGLPASSQERVSEKEINLQHIFIEANSAKLIKNYDEAIKLYKNVLDVDKNNSAAAYEISRLYFHKEDLENAFSFIEKAINFEPKN